MDVGLADPVNTDKTTVQQQGPTDAYAPAGGWSSLFPPLPQYQASGWPSSPFGLTAAAASWPGVSVPSFSSPAAIAAAAMPAPAFGGPDDFGEATVAGFDDDVNYDDDDFAGKSVSPDSKKPSVTVANIPLFAASLPTLGGPEAFGEAVVSGFTEVDYVDDGDLTLASLPNYHPAHIPKLLPSGTKGVPVSLQDLPSHFQSLLSSTGSKGQLSGLQGLPSGLEGLPSSPSGTQLKKGLIPGLKGLPSGLQGLPSGKQGLPSSIQVLTSGSVLLPSGVQGTSSVSNDRYKQFAAAATLPNPGELQLSNLKNARPPADQLSQAQLLKLSSGQLSQAQLSEAQLTKLASGQLQQTQLPKIASGQLSQAQLPILASGQLSEAQLSQAQLLKFASGQLSPTQLSQAQLLNLAPGQLTQAQLLAANSGRQQAPSPLSGTFAPLNALLNSILYQKQGLLKLFTG